MGLIGKAIKADLLIHAVRVGAAAVGLAAAAHGLHAAITGLRDKARKPD